MMNYESASWKVLTSFQNHTPSLSWNLVDRLFVLNLGPHLGKAAIERECIEELKGVSSLRELSRILSEYADFLESELVQVFNICEDDDEDRLLNRFSEVNDFLDHIFLQVESSVQQAEMDIPDDASPRRIQFF